MDLGESINPAIDIGQVEGAFVQGYGLFMMEQILHTPTGVLLTRGPGAYKIPSFNDIPGKFRSQSFGSVLSYDSSAHPELTREIKRVFVYISTIFKLSDLFILYFFI